MCKVSVGLWVLDGTCWMYPYVALNPTTSAGDPPGLGWLVGGKPETPFVYGSIAGQFEVCIATATRREVCGDVHSLRT